MQPDQTTDLNKQATQALDAGQPGKAIDLLQPACSGGSMHPGTWFLLGTAQGMSGNYEAAEQALRKTLELQPGHVQAQISLARVLSHRGQAAAAINHLTELLATHPGNRRAQVTLIETLLHVGRTEEAATQCSQLLAETPADPGLLALLGRAKIELGDHEAARELFEQLLGMNSSNPVAVLGLGHCDRLAGRNRAALAQYEKACELAPANPACWFNRGIVAISLNDMDSAADFLQECFRLNPRDVNAGSQLASVYRHQRKLPESVAVSRRVLEADPDNARARFYVEAFENEQKQAAVQRIPRAVAEATYSQRDVGRHFESSLKGGLEYRAPELLDRAVRHAIGDQRTDLDILELGCGTGLCGSRFADIAHSLVGTDVSASMLDVAREKQAYTTLEVADLADVLAREPGQFDLVIAMDVLCYFGDLGDIFAGCGRVLRDSGIFALSVEKPDHDEPWQLHPYGHFVHSLDHLRACAGKHGFEELHAEETVLRREALEERIGYICLYRTPA